MLATPQSHHPWAKMHQDCSGIFHAYPKRDEPEGITLVPWQLQHKLN
jgi:hypothetical protein